MTHDAATLAEGDQLVATGRTELRYAVQGVELLFATNPDPAHVAIELLPHIERLNPQQRGGLLTIALIELAEAKRRGAWQ